MNERKERGRRRRRKYNLFGISGSFVGSTKLLLDSCLSPLLFAFPPFLSAIKTFLPLFFHFIILLLHLPPKIYNSCPDLFTCFSPCFVSSSILPIFVPLTCSLLYLFVLSSLRLLRSHVQTVIDIHTNSIGCLEIEKYLLYLILN